MYSRRLRHLLVDFYPLIFVIGYAERGRIEGVGEAAGNIGFSVLQGQVVRVLTSANSLHHDAADIDIG